MRYIDQLLDLSDEIESKAISDTGIVVIKLKGLSLYIVALRNDLVRLSSECIYSFRESMSTEFENYSRIAFSSYTISQIADTRRFVYFKIEFENLNESITERVLYSLLKLLETRVDFY